MPSDFLTMVYGGFIVYHIGTLKSRNSSGLFKIKSVVVISLLRHLLFWPFQDDVVKPVLYLWPLVFMPDLCVLTNYNNE